jgi:hypothetical protein
MSTLHFPVILAKAGIQDSKMKKSPALYNMARGVIYNLSRNGKERVREGLTN